MKIFKLLFFLFIFPVYNYAQYVQGDITYMPFLSSFSHDSTSCNSSVTVDHQVQIDNSFAGDVLEVKDNFGNTIYTETNTSGTSPWMVFVPMPDFDVVSDEYVNGNTLSGFVPSQIAKFICDNDTLHTPGGHPFTETVNDPCAYSTISGKVYIDNNNDCQYNTGDSAIFALFVQPQTNHTNTPSNYGASDATDASGDYEVTIQESWFIDYTVAMNPSYQFIFPNSTCTPLSVTSSVLPNTGIDFVLECADVDAWVTGGSGPVHAALPFHFFPSVSNIGCDEVGGTLKLVLDPDVNYNAANSSNPADNVNGDTLFWNYSGLNNITGGAYWNTFSGGIELTPNTSVNIGDTLCFKIISDVPANDINANNNTTTVCLPVVASYDPNIKTVDPMGSGAEGFIPASTDQLTYTIHFQNTGTAAAINVSIRDTLEANVIPSTLKILDASHTMSPSWKDNNVIDFKFNNIYLPDSTSDEPASHGFVKFSIDVQQGLTPGTEIKNRAYIYFDNNPAVITPYALNTIEFNTSALDENKTDEFALFPNPTTGRLNITPQNGFKEVQIYATSGQQVMKATNHELNISSLPAGIYLVKIISNNGVQVKKIVKQ